MAALKAKWLREVQEILGQETFRTWFEELEALRAELDETSARYEDLLAQANVAEFRAELTQKNGIDTLYNASEHEDAAAHMLAEATDLENRSMENLGGFEEQRLKTSELWFKLEAVEHDLSEVRQQAIEARIRELERSQRKLKVDYEREAAKKQRLWDDVEAMWAVSLEKNLSIAENRKKGEVVRRRAEVLLARAEEGKERADALKAEAEAVARRRAELEEGLLELLQTARDSFGAVIHEDFLYWMQREETKAVWLTPLISDPITYNISLEVGRIYRCDRSRGVEFIEPLIEADDGARDDSRLEDFFSAGASPAEADVE